MKSLPPEARRKWRWGFSTLGCPDLDLPQVAALARAHRIAGVELRALGGEMDLPAYWRRRGESPEAVAAQACESGLRIVGVNTSFRLVGGDVRARAALLDHVPYAEALGAPFLRVFDGGGTADACELAEAAQTLEWWRAWRREHGVKTDLMVETHDMLLDVERINRFVSRVPHCAVLWDAHHTWRRGGAPLRATLAALAGRLVHVHVKDSVSSMNRWEFDYVLPGTGDFPFRELATMLGQSAFVGVVSLEWERAWHPQLPPLEQALRSARMKDWIVDSQ